MSLLIPGLIVAAFAQGLLTLFTLWVARSVEKRLPPPGRFIDVDGTRIHYVEAGEGTPVVMVHGLGGSSANFSLRLFERLPAGVRAIALDRPGNGYSGVPDGWGSSLPEQAALVARFIEVMGLERPLVVGHSLGGAVVLTLALERPDLVRGLALIAPLTQHQQDIPAPFRKLAIRSRLVRAWFGWTLNVPHAVVKRREVMDALFGPEAPPADFATSGRALLGALPRIYNASAEDLLALDAAVPRLVARVAEIGCDIELLFGDGDRILACDLHGQGLKTAVPEVRYRTVHGGHMLPITQPDEVAATIVAALSR